MERLKASIRFSASLVTALLFGLLATQGLYAQIDTGAVLGTVKDQTGAVIPGVKVSLTNEGTNLTVTTTSGSDGGYIFTPVKIGIYSVSAESQGFSKAIQNHLTLNISQQLVVDLTLKPGTVTEIVEVTAAPPALQTQDASVGQVVGSKEVNNLPLNGRNFTFLAQVVAGVNTPQADTRGNASTGAFSANGLRPAQNNYLLDGIDNNSNTVDFLNGTNFIVLPPVDAVQEFKVQTSDYSAQYGRAGGAILNATIKSGTNQIHGDAFEFLRNDKMDAADFFEDEGGTQKGEYRQNQFGFTVGGPVVIPHVINGKNKLFFFGDYEALRRRQGTVFTSTVPTMAERNSGFTDMTDLITGQSGSPHSDDLNRMFPVGTVFDPATTRSVTAGAVDPVTGLTAAATGFVRDPFSTCAANTTNFTGANVAACNLNMLPAGRLDANAIKLLDVYPNPTNGGFTNNNTNSPVLSENRNAFDTRIDLNQSDKDQIFGRFSYVDDPQFIPGAFGGIADGGAFQQGLQGALSVQAALGWTHTFSPTVVNEARIGFNRIHTSRFGPVANQLGIPAQFGIANVPQVSENGGLPAFGINGLNTLGSNAFLPSDEISQTWQYADNLTKVYGKHSFKAGVEYQRVKFSTLQPPWSHGEFDYGGNYTDIPEGNSDNTGRAQFVITPTTSSVNGALQCNSNAACSAPDYVGGTSQLYTSNIFLTDDHKNYFGSYFQDDWKYSPKLTLNLGIRWDYFGQTYEKNGAQGNIVPGVPGTGGGAEGTGAQYLIPAKRQGDTLSPSFLSVLAADGITLKYVPDLGLATSQKTNFSPRVGFAYQFTPKLVMRGGYGIFYGGFENRGYGPNIGENYPFQFQFSYGSPNGETPTTVPGSPLQGCATNYVFEFGFTCTPLNSAVVLAEGLGPHGLEYNYKTPYTQGWNLTFQYEVTPTMTVSAAYVGNTVHHLETGPGGNQVSQILPPGTCLEAPSCPGKNPGNISYVPFPDFSTGFSYIATEGNSYYHGLQMSVEKHYSAGLNFLATYTYSNARSDAGDLLNGGINEGSRSAPYLPGVGIQGGYGTADFSIRNVFHLSGGYDLPFGKGRHFLANSRGAVNQILGDWTTQWIVTAEGGQPLTIGCPVGTTAGLGCVALLVPGQNTHGSKGVDGFLNAAAFAQPAVATTIGQSDYAPLGGEGGQTSGPGISRVDFSLFKNFRISERYSMQFRSEFFNILNHPTFNAPGFGGNGVSSVPGSTDFTNSGFGKIGSTRFPGQDSRQIQFALKFYF